MFNSESLWYLGHDLLPSSLTPTPTPQLSQTDAPLQVSVVQKVGLPLPFASSQGIWHFTRPPMYLSPLQFQVVENKFLLNVVRRLRTPSPTHWTEAVPQV